MEPGYNLSHDERAELLCYLVVAQLVSRILMDD